MVERLKAAIEKARQQRDEASTAPSSRVQAPAAAPASVAAAWESLPAIELDPARLRRHRIVTHDKSNAVYAAYDVLRTRLGKVFRDNSWTTLGVVSPTKACGKTVTAANLAFSLARSPDRSTVLIDLDMRRPALAEILGPPPERRRISRFLRGEIGLAEAFVRPSPNLAIGFNTEAEREPAELLHNPATAAALRGLVGALQPSMVICDLPPMLVCDDALGLMSALDAVIVIAAAGQTRAREIEECERLIGDAARFLGVVLNKHDAEPDDLYRYDYDAA